MHDCVDAHLARDLEGAAGESGEVALEREVNGLGEGDGVAALVEKAISPC